MSVEIWRPQILKYVGSPQGGADFWLAWIQRESGGNPCSYTSLRESGLFQLEPPDNTDRGGTSEALLRAACGSGQTVARALTAADIAEQMLSFQRYLAYLITQAKAKLAAAGVSWSEDSPSFWKLVKLQHAYPAPTLGWLNSATAALGHPPADWDELRSTISGYSSVLDNAEWVGNFGSGGLQIPIAVAAVAGGGILLYYLLKRRRR